MQVSFKTTVSEWTTHLITKVHVGERYLWYFIANYTDVEDLKMSLVPLVTKRLEFILSCIEENARLIYAKLVNTNYCICPSAWHMLLNLMTI